MLVWFSRGARARLAHNERDELARAALHCIDGLLSDGLLLSTHGVAHDVEDAVGGQRRPGLGALGSRVGLRRLVLAVGHGETAAMVCTT